MQGDSQTQNIWPLFLVGRSSLGTTGVTYIGLQGFIGDKKWEKRITPSEL